MKRVLLCTAVVLLAATAARADIVGTWSSGVSGAYNVYTLNVASTAGEVMEGFDIKVKSSVAGFNYYADMFGTKTIFLASGSGYPYTWFLLDPAQLNIVSGSTGVDTTYLKSAFAATSTGSYASGWTSLNLLQIAVPTSSGITPSKFTVTDADEAYTYAVAAVGPSAILMPITFVPEPSTLVLLAAGLFGLAAYAWRKRK